MVAVPIPWRQKNANEREASISDGDILGFSLPNADPEAGRRKSKLQKVDCEE